MRMRVTWSHRTFSSAFSTKSMLCWAQVNHLDRQDVQGVGRWSRRWKMFKALEDVQGIGRCSRHWKMFKALEDVQGIGRWSRHWKMFKALDDGQDVQGRHEFSRAPCLDCLDHPPNPGASPWPTVVRKASAG